MLALALVQWFAVLHECGHETLFRGKRANSIVGQVAGFFALIPFYNWKRVHARHHKWTGWQDVDPTTAALVPRELQDGRAHPRECLLEVLDSAVFRALSREQLLELAAASRAVREV